MYLKDIITEGKFSKPTYAYHATMKRNVRSIVKHGLIPNKEEDGYGSAEVGSAGYTLTPLPGVYFTKTAKDAGHISNHLGTGDGAVIIAKIQQKQVELDEDRLTHDVFEENRLATVIRRTIEEYEDAEDPRLDKALSKEIRDWTERILENIIDAKFPRDAIEKANVESSVVRYVTAIVDFLYEQIAGSSDNDSDLKDAQRELTIKLRRLSTGHATFKINQQIGFSGKNRIVGIYFPKDRVGWGDLGDFGGFAYHKYDSPMELLKKVGAV